MQAAKAATPPPKLWPTKETSYLRRV